MGGVILLVILWLVLATLILGMVFRRELWLLWREPVLTCPVLIIESDDWGAGPNSQATALAHVAERLATFHDQAGRSPVMTLGIVLAVPDGARIEAGQFATYHRIALDDARMQPIVNAIRAGVARGVFALQLHGMEHYWPETLMQLARQSEPVREWVRQSPDSWTENLPSPVQSRWTDTSALPSLARPNEAISAAVRAEVDAFVAVFGTPPRVVVPPTFVWDAQVERAWAESGVMVLVTPGCRFDYRDEHGQPAARKRMPIHHGQLADSGMTYLVRDAYFEPEFGHRAESVPARMKEDVARGRPTLLETHRGNFVKEPVAAQAALEELAHAIELVLHDFPQVRFVSSEALAGYFRAADAAWVETRFGVRLAVWIARAKAISRLRKLAIVSGAGLLLLAVSRIAAVN